MTSMTKICNVKSLKHKQAIKKKKKSVSFIDFMLPSTAEINIYLYNAGNTFPGMRYLLHFLSSTNA